MTVCLFRCVPMLCPTYFAAHPVSPASLLLSYRHDGFHLVRTHGRCTVQRLRLLGTSASLFALLNPRFETDPHSHFTHRASLTVRHR